MTTRRRACDVRRKLGHVDHRLAGATSKRDDAAVTRFLGDREHLHRVHGRVNGKLDLLLELCAGDTDGNFRSHNVRAENGNSRLERGCQDPVLIRDLRKLAPEYSKELAY